MFEGLFPIWLNIILLLGGLAVVTFAADKFVDSAVVIARKTGMPRMIIGATIVSLGTTLPEFCVAFLGGFFDRAPTALGGAIGSTICNIGLILGTCILIRPIMAQRRLYWQHGVIMILAGVLVWLLSLNGQLTRWDFLIITAGLIVYILLSIKILGSLRSDSDFKLAAEYSTNNEAAIPDYSLKKAVILFIVGAVGVAIGAWLIVEDAVIVARWLNVPELVIGLTVVAFGTSIPEYVTCLTATFKRHGEIAAGNIIGADILDILWVLGPGALSFSHLALERQTLVLDYPAMMTLMALLVLFGIVSQKLYRWQGGVILAAYGVYLVLVFRYFI